MSIVRRAPWVIVAAAAWLAAGCGSPPSVVPLLNVTDRVLAIEQRSLQEQAGQVAAHFAQSRAALTDAFEADLQMRSSLEKTWVADHALVYAGALESLARQQFKQEQALATRRENLQIARDVQARAIELLQRQDRLFEAVPDVRRRSMQLLSKEDGDER